MSVTLGEFEQLILLALMRLGPDAYGATVRREIEEHAEREVSISAVYTTLERLERKGLVHSRIGAPTPERGGRRRRHFELLPLGARSLRNEPRREKGMPHNEALTNRVQAALAHIPRVEQKRMFGGIAFMVRDKMCVSVGTERIMCRIDPAIHDAALKHAKAAGPSS